MPWAVEAAGTAYHLEFCHEYQASSFSPVILSSDSSLGRRNRVLHGSLLKPMQGTFVLLPGQTLCYPKKKTGCRPSSPFRSVPKSRSTEWSLQHGGRSRAMYDVITVETVACPRCRFLMEAQKIPRFFRFTGPPISYALPSLHEDCYFGPSICAAKIRRPCL